MQAFVEILSGIVRAGEGCTKYGDPWELSVAFSSTDGKTAIIKALRSNGELKPAHYKALKKEFDKLGLEPDWERIK